MINIKLLTSNKPGGINLLQATVLFILFLSSFLSACQIQESDSNNKQHFLSVEAAKALMENQNNWVLFEVSKPKNYKEGHLNEAYSIWRTDYTTQKFDTYNGLYCTKKELEDLLSKFGINQNTTIILYDTRGCVEATRLSWQLELWGFNQFYLIDGGKKAWQQHGFELTKVLPKKRKKSNFKFTKKQIDKSLFADWQDIHDAINDTNILILDTREPYEYQGQPFIKNKKIQTFKKNSFCSGAIPTSIHFNWSTAVDLKTDNTTKSKKDIEWELQSRNITKDKSIIVYCHSGVRSSHTSHILRHYLGYQKVKNYDGSWIEWSYLHTQKKAVPIMQLTNTTAVDSIYNALVKMEK